ncbi:hypothetical protein EI555_012845, partial [Monodon monoceros]
MDFRIQSPQTHWLLYFPFLVPSAVGKCLYSYECDWSWKQHKYTSSEPNTSTATSPHGQSHMHHPY